MEWIVPMSDQYWDYLDAADGDMNEDYPFDEYGRGGYSFAFLGVTDPRPLVLEYSKVSADGNLYCCTIRKCTGSSEPWEWVQHVDEDGADPYEVLDMMTDYEAGALDFLTEMRDHTDEWYDKDGTVWYGTCEEDDEAEVRRYLEQVVRELIMNHDV